MRRSIAALLLIHRYLLRLLQWVSRSEQIIKTICFLLNILSNVNIFVITSSTRLLFSTKPASTILVHPTFSDKSVIHKKVNVTAETIIVPLKKKKPLPLAFSKWIFAIVLIIIHDKNRYKSSLHDTILPKLGLSKVFGVQRM